MIEVIDRLKPEKVKVICYTHDPLEQLNIKTDINYEFFKVPFTGLKPFLIRNLFFQLYTAVFESLWKEPEDTSISIGVCSFNGDIINIQYAHFLWEKLYFKATPVSWYKAIYKVILHRYLTLCEDFCYSKEGVRFVFLSDFIKEAIVKRYKVPKKNYTIAYSSADADQFKPTKVTREEAFEILKEKHPELSTVKTDRPCLLFVGAFERKGLPLFINKVPDHYELIIVGQPQKGSSFKIPTKENIHHVGFSRNINLFYNACDFFVFPTIFEPFGLVLLEAAISGMNILTSRSSVGASELLTGLPGVEFCDPFNSKR